MADAVVSLVVERIGELLINEVVDEIGLLSGVKTEVSKLLSKFQNIRGILDDAEQKMIKDSNVRSWLEELEDISYEMDDILDEWNTMILKMQLKEHDVTDTPKKKKNVCSFISSSCFSVKNVGGRRYIAIKIRNLNNRFDLVIEEMRQFKFVSNSLVSSSSSQDWKKISSTSMVDISNVKGRDSDVNILIQKLVGESSSSGDVSGAKVMSIIGLGGIGKTTLAQLVYNDNRVKAHFDQQIWVCVSDPFDEIKVAKGIIQSVKKDSPNLDELHPLLEQINELTKGKKFILVLDDVWTEDYTKFEPFLISLKDCSHGSMILLTTRSVDVARALRSTYMHNVEILDESESWSLFCQIAFSGENMMKREELESYGKEIIKKCNGLPLAINTIASLLRYESSTDEWEMILSSNIWDLKIAEVQLFPHLYLSYKSLPAPLKRCFTFCAVFPKDQVIAVDDLIRIWMAEGYLGGLSIEDNICVYARGREFFETLARLSFFQEFKMDEWSFDDRIILCKMHDIVHDFVQYLTKGKFLVVEGVSKKSLDESNAIGSKNMRHVFFYNKGEVNDKACTIKINGHLRGFLGNGFKMERMSLDLLSSLSSVRELRLSECSLIEITSEIGNLIHLRYLDLSNNRDLNELPTTVCNLCNLQTLNISATGITCLPKGSEKLISLRHFIFNSYFFSSLEEVSKLTRLQSLVGGVYKDQLCWLKNLNQLGGHLKIVMENRSNAEIDKTVLISNSHLRSINIDCDGATLEALDLPPKLSMLSICHIIEDKLPTSMLSKLVNLKHLTLCSSDELSTLPPLGKLPVLEKLILEDLEKLKVVGRSFLGLELEESEEGSWSTFGFPKLKVLKINCNNLDEWEDISEEEEEDTTLSIMPLLQNLHLEHCPKLKGLPIRLIRKASKLEIIQIEGFEYTPFEVLGLNSEDVFGPWW